MATANPTANPYAAPGALPSDVDAAVAVQPVRLWPPRGRIGRLRMLAYSMAVYLIFMVLAGIVTLVVGMANSSTALATAWALLYVGHLFAGALIVILRSHDMDLSGWASLLLLIPLVILYWLLKRGTPGVNRFGEPPPPNTTGVKVLAWCFLIVPVTGLVAAIALPAYQDYTDRDNRSTVQML